MGPAEDTADPLCYARRGARRDYGDDRAGMFWSFEVETGAVATHDASVSDYIPSFDRAVSECNLDTSQPCGRWPSSSPAKRPFCIPGGKLRTPRSIGCRVSTGWGLSAARCRLAG